MDVLQVVIKKKATLRLVGGTETQNGLVLHLLVSDKNWEGYLGCGGPPQGLRGPCRTPVPQAQGSSAEKEFP